METREVLDKVLRGKRLRPATRRHYCEALGSLASYSGEWPDSSVVINEWLASLSRYSDATVKMWFEQVNAGGKYVQKIMGKNGNGTYKVPNPCEDAERPKVSKKRRRYFSPEEIVSVIKACINEYELLLVLTLIDSACRIGELVTLSGGKVGDGFIDVVGKTGERKYRLNGNICKRLRLLAGGDDKPVFYRKDGEFYPDGNGLAHRVRYIVERTGIKGSKTGVHTLRHSSASLVAQESGQALIVKALLQHDDIATSMKYIHDVDDMVIKDDKYSPLRLLGKRYGEAVGGGSGGQLELSDGGVGGGTAVIPVSGVGLVEVEGASLVGDLFPEVESGVAVRTVLREDDLKLMRKVFVFYARYNDGNDVTRGRVLMRRMLRKGGSKFYSKR